MNRLVSVVGSGAAGLNAAIHCAEFGIDPEKIVLVTDGWGSGTSYNAGSDKQTYYKLSISGKGTDSPYLMAKDLFSGKAMHGDIALCEAAGSIEEFFHLIELGVRFPKNKYGLYPGYQTDNDLRQRATSIGPYTSREMVRRLAEKVVEIGIPVLPHHLVNKFFVDNIGSSSEIVGLSCLDLRPGNLFEKNKNFHLFDMLNLTLINSPVIIYATGGPANVFQDSVYPENHFCSHGIGIEIGAKLQNLQYMQYGIASIKFRWNLSGSYQQVIPTYYILNEETGEPREILRPYLSSIKDVAYQTFLKGYQWPFNPRLCDIRARQHSSLIDLIVFN
ncbi:MAG: FAD-binding protein, partial [Promethearchaeota archaeon]